MRTPSRPCFGRQRIGSRPGLSPDSTRSEFAFLPDAERSQLAKLVAEFRQVTSTVNPMAPATGDTVERGAALVPGHHSAARIRPLRERRGLPVGEANRTGDCTLEASRNLRSCGSVPNWTTRATPASGSGRISRTRSPRRMKTSWKRPKGSEVPSKTSPDEVAPDRFPYLSFRSLREQSEPVEA